MCIYIYLHCTHVEPDQSSILKGAHTVRVLPWLTYSMASWPAAPSNLSAVDSIESYEAVMVCVYLFICKHDAAIHTSIALHMYKHAYIYLCVCIYTYACVYVYIHIII